MTKSFTLVQLHYFSAVARHENMRIAAEELNVTQSTLSSAIHRLEQELGVSLFHRLNTRRLRLTGPGRRLLTGSRILLEDAGQLQRAVSSEREALVGELVAGIYGPIAPFHAPAILSTFHRLYPGVDLTFIEGDQEHLMRAMSDGACEVALMYDHGLSVDFDARVLKHIPPHVLVAADHPRAQTPDVPVHLSDFAEEPYILLDLSHARDYYLAIFKAVGLRPRLRHRVAGYETVRSYVSMGHGYSLLNQRLAHDVTYSGASVVPLMIADPVPRVDVVFVRPRGIELTKKSQAFEAVCASMYPSA